MIDNTSIELSFDITGSEFDVPMDEDRAELFRCMYESLAGHVYFAESTTKAVSAACEILSSIRANRVAISAVRNDILDEIERFCQQNNIELLKPPFGDNSAQAINEAEVGISEVAFGIAQTGTVVEATRDDATRLISSLPAVHVCFLNQKDLLLSLHEASSRLQAIYQDPKDRVSVTFISGPSRSGDIEMKITLGVHGPAESHVIVLSNSES